MNSEFLLNDDKNRISWAFLLVWKSVILSASTNSETVTLTLQPPWVAPSAEETSAVLQKCSCHSGSQICSSSPATSGISTGHLFVTAANSLLKCPHWKKLVWNVTGYLLCDSGHRHHLQIKILTLLAIPILKNRLTWKILYSSKIKSLSWLRCYKWFQW